MNFILLLVVFFSTNFADGAKSDPFTSSYTNLAKDCKASNAAEDESRGQDPIVTCKGFGGYQLKLNFSAINSYLLIENLKSEALPNISIPLKSYEKGSVEWRNFKGKPFAIIVRSQDLSALPEKPGIETLVIKGLRGFEYIDFSTKAADPKANETARKLADSAKNSHP